MHIGVFLIHWSKVPLLSIWSVAVTLCSLSTTFALSQSMTLWNRKTQMCRTEFYVECTVQLLLQSSVSGVAISLLESGSRRTFWAHFVMDARFSVLSKCWVNFRIEGFLLFDCFVCRQNVTRLKRFARYGHYTGEVEDIIITRFNQSINQSINQSV